MTSHIKPVSTTEYDDVIQAVQAYIDGYRSGDIAGIEKAFHEDSIMWGYTGDELLQGPAVPVFASFFKALGASPNTRSRMDILAIAPTAAVVRVDMENDILGASFHDFLSLLKIDGQWKIISKIFQRYA
ncbi:nuclear transport factor 2 family protein [Pseudomonas sp. GD04087]|uniref:nuclear transport factor 2 family protein n=1 Tax=unclassified Pseudomonas TaxID=196821 RepID=UPI00244CFDCB|nr:MULTISPECIES: nuclear transport factor 2 family protein [unclassified Pseudomonas]MDH0289317.1 nuclear transport factor 2 family protein [Pseudomonas sp. GD04087]MDH1052881.1 nuclear transport factor 2 family protein [Pseudomonas sp. GD03903]MDH2002616.1 nuclear transport factor 2 family protein [Pseudomonas sp. GD03691]